MIIALLKTEAQYTCRKMNKFDELSQSEHTLIATSYYYRVLVIEHYQSAEAALRLPNYLYPLPKCNHHHILDWFCYFYFLNFIYFFFFFLFGFFCSSLYCSQFWGVMKNAAMDVVIHGFWCPYIHISIG